jgi:hypothetical protein
MGIATMDILIRICSNDHGISILNHLHQEKIKSLVPIKRIINFVKADVTREEYFSRPVEIVPMY